MGQILLIAFATYLLYNFIFRFVIPLVRVTRQVKRQVRDFQQHAGNMPGGTRPGSFSAGGFQPGNFGQSNGYGQTNGNAQSYQDTVFQQQAEPGSKEQKPKPKKDDYIDFEEIK